MKIGVAYYPEHWPESRWPVDAKLMKQLHIDVVRIGEFAWSRLEPKRERLDMDWLHRAIKVLAEAGLKVILCTPTAAPPPWLFLRHPDIVPMDREGKRWNPGSRRDACLNNRAYQKYARRIVTELAKEFGTNPNVYAWQVDNELGCHGSGRCYCPDCEQAFRQWLKGRYGSIQRLNKKWGTVFWSQEFTDWYEIPAPRRTPAGAHPSLALDYSRFISATYRDFLKTQAEIIKTHAGKNCIVTTNSIGLHLDQIDQFSLGAFQDVASVDNYPVEEGNLDVMALNLDLTRSVKRRAFWVLEQQAGATLIGGVHSQPRPGQLRLWAFQAAARGAELISFFRWRTCAFGQEMHWYGLLDADGTPRRRFEELRRAIPELKEKAPLWEGKLPQAKVALVLDYQSHWALADGSLGLEIDYVGHFRTLYRLLRRMGVQVDIIPPEGDVNGYRALIVPMPFICSAETVKKLEVHVTGGGAVLVTAPAGYRTNVNTTVSTPTPAELGELLGVEVVEHDILGAPGLNSMCFRGGDEQATFECNRFCSVLELRGADPVATYEREFYAGSAAATVNSKGDGKAFFMAATCSDGCYEHMLQMTLDAAGVEANSWSSETIETIPLETSDKEGKLVFVLNHAGTPASLPLPQGGSCVDLLTDTQMSGSVELGGYEVALLRM